MKNARVAQLLAGKGDNYILPFMWQHGEDEETLKEYIHVIREGRMPGSLPGSAPSPRLCRRRLVA